MGILEQLKSILGKTTTKKQTLQGKFGLQIQTERRTTPRRNARKGTRVLVIDDSATVLAVLRHTLQSAGCITLEAPDAERGIELACTKKPALIFLDIVLPGMNGFSALRQLRRDPRTHDIPIIMISGNEQATEQFFGTRIGADDFMKKPFSRFDVFSRIESLLDETAIPRRMSRGVTGSQETPSPN